MSRKEVNESHLQLLIKLYDDFGSFPHSCKFFLPCLTHLIHSPVEAHSLVWICWIECCTLIRHRAWFPRKQHATSSHDRRGCCSYQSMVVFPRSFPSFSASSFTETKWSSADCMHTQLELLGNYLLHILRFLSHYVHSWLDPIAHLRITIQQVALSMMSQRRSFQENSMLIWAWTLYGWRLV